MRYGIIIITMLIASNSYAISFESIGRSTSFKVFPHVIGATACGSVALAALGSTAKIIYLEMKEELEHPENPHDNLTLTPIAVIFGIPTTTLSGLLSYLFTCAAADECKVDLSNAIYLNVALASIITTCWAKYYNYL